MLETILLIVAIVVLVLVAVALLVVAWRTSVSAMALGRWTASQDAYHAALDTWIKVKLNPFVNMGGGGVQDPPNPPCKFGQC